jgi:transcriptional regulator with XRE-family HTH domain
MSAYSSLLRILPAEPARIPARVRYATPAGLIPASEWIASAPPHEAARLAHILASGSRGPAPIARAARSKTWGITLSEWPSGSASPQPAIPARSPATAARLRAELDPDFARALRRSALPFALAPLLCAMRRAAGISSAELARRAGITRTNVSLAENGHIIHSPHTLAALAEACGYTLTLRPVPASRGPAPLAPVRLSADPRQAAAIAARWKSACARPARKPHALTRSCRLAHLAALARAAGCTLMLHASPASPGLPELPPVNISRAALDGGAR